MKIYPMPTQCPACNSRLRVSTLVCSNPDCLTQVKGEYEPNEFALLPPEQLEFLRLYIKVRGNLKEVERIMGVSYPTVRARFEAMLRVLGYEVVEEPLPPNNTQEIHRIIDALEQGEIKAKEAEAQMRALKKR